MIQAGRAENRSSPEVDAALSQRGVAGVTVELGALYLATGSLSVVAIAAAVIVVLTVSANLKRESR
jgi:hypothetical protein